MSINIQNLNLQQKQQYNQNLFGSIGQLEKSSLDQLINLAEELKTQSKQIYQISNKVNPNQNTNFHLENPQNIQSNPQNTQNTTKKQPSGGFRLAKNAKRKNLLKLGRINLPQQQQLQKEQEPLLLGQDELFRRKNSDTKSQYTVTLNDNISDNEMAKEDQNSDETFVSEKFSVSSNQNNILLKNQFQHLFQSNSNQKKNIDHNKTNTQILEECQQKKALNFPENCIQNTFDLNNLVEDMNQQGSKIYGNKQQQIPKFSDNSKFWVLNKKTQMNKIYVYTSKKYSPISRTNSFETQQIQDTQFNVQKVTKKIKKITILQKNYRD